MPDTPSIIIVKKFDYRDQREEFSNRMHFSGTTPADPAAWKALADALIGAEAPIYPSDVSFVRAYGYEAGTEHSVAQIDYEAAPNTPVIGQFLPTGGALSTPGDVAATVRWYTGELNSRGKKIYCRKYVHRVFTKATDRDELDQTQANAIFAWAGGLSSGGIVAGWKYCGPQGAVLQVPEVAKYLTTRTLKRRGKRPLP